jgi:hypothetical protein
MRRKWAGRHGRVGGRRPCRCGCGSCWGIETRCFLGLRCSEMGGAGPTWPPTDHERSSVIAGIAGLPRVSAARVAVSANVYHTCVVTSFPCSSFSKQFPAGRVALAAVGGSPREPRPPTSRTEVEKRQTLSSGSALFFFPTAHGHHPPLAASAGTPSPSLRPRA